MTKIYSYYKIHGENAKGYIGVIQLAEIIERRTIMARRNTERLVFLPKGGTRW